MDIPSLDAVCTQGHIYVHVHLGGELNFLEISGVDSKN